MAKDCQGDQQPKPLPHLPPDDEIIAACEQQSAVDDRGYLNKCAVYPSRVAPEAFIKCAYENDGMLAEAHNQEFAYKALQQMPEQDTIGIRIPRIYRVISRDGMVYIVMEYVHGKTIKESLDKDPMDTCLRECYTQVAKAIKLFLSIPINTVIPGPVGGGRIRHPLFKDTIASTEYLSVTQLQEHINVVANQPRNNYLKVDFSKETLCFCFSDLYEGNFIRTDAGNLYIVDFQHVSVVPTSFMTYALNQPRPICFEIKNIFDYLPQDNLQALKVAGHYFLICSRKVGLPL